MLVLEYMENTDVERFCKDGYNEISQSKALNWCLQLAQASKFLAEKKIVHRDISARNCFLTDKFDLKLGDFGLARKGMDDSGVYCAVNPDRQLPFPWLSVEAFKTMTFTHASDVWAVG